MSQLVLHEVHIDVVAFVDPSSRPVATLFIKTNMSSPFRGWRLCSIATALLSLAHAVKGTTPPQDHAIVDENLTADNALVKEIATADKEAAAKRKEAFLNEIGVQESAINTFETTLKADNAALKGILARAEAKAAESKAVAKTLADGLEALKKQKGAMVAEGKAAARKAVIQKFRSLNFELKEWEKVTFGTENTGRNTADRKTEQFAGHVNSLYHAALANERQAATLQEEANDLTTTSTAVSEAADAKEGAGDLLGAQLSRSEAAQLTLQANSKRDLADALLADAEMWSKKQKKMEPATDADVEVLPMKPNKRIKTAKDFLAAR
ncbi:unnamed protein product [Amoebophrya sp. A25]|nr:unnamed protein product [Amoebophrya sp. A25]|eukprot:GSA25T00001608001.1